MSATPIQLFSAEFALGDDPSSRVLTGLAVPYNVLSDPSSDGTRHMFRPGAFARSVAERGSKLRLFTGHDTTRLPIGRAAGFDDKPDGLRISFEFADTAGGNEALQLVRQGYVSGLSIGVDGLSAAPQADGSFTHSEARLREVSLVNDPAFAGAGFSAGSSGPRIDVQSARLRLRLAEKGFYHD